MLKKVLIGIGIVVVLGVVIMSLLGYGAVKMASDKFEEHKPELRQYISMTVDEQNAYVEKNLDSLLSQVIKDSNNAEDQANFEKLKNAPDAKAAGIELGRSILAMAILSSDELTAELQDNVKAKFQKEFDELNTRVDNWTKIADKYVPNEKK